MSIGMSLQRPRMSMDQQSMLAKQLTSSAVSNSFGGGGIYGIGGDGVLQSPRMQHLPGDALRGSRKEGRINDDLMVTQAHELEALQDALPRDQQRGRVTIAQQRGRQSLTVPGAVHNMYDRRVGQEPLESSAWESDQYQGIRHQRTKYEVEQRAG